MPRKAVMTLYTLLFACMVSIVAFMQLIHMGVAAAKTVLADNGSRPT